MKTTKTTFMWPRLVLFAVLPALLWGQTGNETNTEEKQPKKEKLSIESKGESWREKWRQQKREKHDFRVYFARGVMEEHDGKYKRALGQYEKAIKYRKDCGPAYLHKGICLVNLEKVDEAITSFVVAQQLRPDLVDVYVELGKAYAQQYRTTEAREQLAKLQKLDKAKAAELDAIIRKKESYLKGD